MAQTQLRGTQVLDSSIQRSDLDVSTAGEALIRKLIAGTNVVLTSTGVDSGTGDVTLDFTNIFTLTPENGAAAPATNSIKVYAQPSSPSLFNTRLVYTEDTGETVRFAANPIDRLVIAWHGVGTNTLATNGAPTATGTATTSVDAATNVYTKTRRTEYLVTVAATTAVVGVRGALPATVGGVSAGKGGFYMEMLAAPATGVATATTRFYMGMNPSGSAPTDVEPSSIANIVGFGWDAADTNCQIMHRGAGAVTKINLGATFPVPTVDRTTFYKLNLHSPAGTTQSIGYEVINMTTGDTATGSITTNMPGANTLIGPRCYMSVGGTSSVIGIAFAKMYLEANML